MPKKLDISIQYTIGDDSHVKVVSKVFVDGKQIGFISNMRIELDSKEYLPKVIVDFVRDLNSDQYKQLSQESQEAIQKACEDLKKFPLVVVTSPA